MEAVALRPARLFRGPNFSTLCRATAIPEVRRLSGATSDAGIVGATNVQLFGPGPVWPSYIVGPLHAIGVVSPPSADVVVTLSPPDAPPFTFVIPANAGPAWRRQFRPALEGAITVQFSAPGGVVEIVHGVEP